MKSMINAILTEHSSSCKNTGRGWAPVNIALCKYWGKRDESINLPLTDSLSISLGKLGAQTEIAPAGTDCFTLNGELLDTNAKAAVRLRRFLDPFRTATVPGFELKSQSDVPLAAGLASSASGFAALVMALNDLFSWSLTKRELSILARLGSGSASRSVYEGFVQWHAGNQSDGMDSFAEQLPYTWPALRVGLLMLSSSEKPIGSREGMRRTTATSELYKVWPAKVAASMAALKVALELHDFDALGAAAESNALAMHATMIDSWPPVLYWLPESVSAMQKVWAAREAGLSLYFTMDAGPNIKLLYEAHNEAAVREIFPAVQMVLPFSD